MSASVQRRVAAYFALRVPAGAGARAPAPGPEMAQAGKTPANQALPTAAPWSAREYVWLAIIYLAQVLGVIAKQLYDDVGAGRDPRLPAGSLVIAFIVSAVSFPTVYHSLQAQSSQGMRLFLAFQSGFFWRSILAHVTPAQ